MFDISSDPITIDVPGPLKKKVPPSNKPFRWVEWQTWKFNKPQPKKGWAHGIHLWCDYWNFKLTLNEMGYTVYFRDISND